MNDLDNSASLAPRLPESIIVLSDLQFLDGAMTSLSNVYLNEPGQLERNSQVYQLTQNGLANYIDPARHEGRQVDGISLVFMALCLGATPDETYGRPLLNELAKNPLLRDQDRIIISELAGIMWGLGKEDSGQGLPDQTRDIRAAGVMQQKVNTALASEWEDLNRGGRHVTPYELALWAFGAGATLDHPALRGRDNFVNRAVQAVSEGQ